MMGREAGFTLVELLAAMVAAALLLTALGSITGGLSNAVERQGQARSSDRPGAMMTALVLRARPSADGAIIATPQQLRFPISPPDAARDGQPLLADLSITPAARGSMLTIQLYDAQTALPLPGTQLRASNVNGMMRFDAAEDTTPDGTTRLTSVTLHLPLRDGGTLPIIASPRVTAAAGCVFDPISLECRR